MIKYVWEDGWHIGGGRGEEGCEGFGVNKVVGRKERGNLFK